MDKVEYSEFYLFNTFYIKKHEFSFFPVVFASGGS